MYIQRYIGGLSNHVCPTGNDRIVGFRGGAEHVHK
jgi:hypothetical protein